MYPAPDLCRDFTWTSKHEERGQPQNGVNHTGGGSCYNVIRSLAPSRSSAFLSFHPLFSFSSPLLSAFALRSGDTKGYKMESITGAGY